jgi:hypothetical protein
MSAMKKISATITPGQSIAVKAALALLLAAAFMFSTGMALAGEEEGAGKAGAYGVEISESTGLPDSTQLRASSIDADTADSLAVEMFKGETEGAGRSGRYAVESSESTGLPDSTELEASFITAASVAAETFKGEDEGAGSAGRFAVESSESTGLPDTTIWK